MQEEMEKIAAEIEREGFLIESWLGDSNRNDELESNGCEECLYLMDDQYYLLARDEEGVFDAKKIIVEDLHEEDFVLDLIKKNPV